MGLLYLADDVTKLHHSMLVVFALCTTSVFQSVKPTCILKIFALLHILTHAQRVTCTHRNKHTKVLVWTLKLLQQKTTNFKSEKNTWF